MPSCELLEPDGRFSALFIGQTGTGKTPAACSFQTTGENTRVWNWDFDGRIRGLLGTPWVDKSRVSYEYFPPMKQATPTFTKINDFCELLQTQINMGKNPYETIVVDSLTGLCNCFICDAIPLAHVKSQGGSKGRKLGTINLPGMEEYGYEANGLDQVLSFLRSIPIKNLICTAHIVDKYGKENPEDPYSQTVVVGEALSLRPRITAKVGIYFDHIFKFYKDVVNGKMRYFVEFRGDLARTTFSALPDRVEITNKNLYMVMQQYLVKEK